MLTNRSHFDRYLTDLIQNTYHSCAVPLPVQSVIRQMNDPYFNASIYPGTDPFLPVLEVIATALPLLKSTDQDVFITFFCEFQHYINRLPDSLRPDVNVMVANKIAAQLKQDIINNQENLPTIDWLLIFSKEDVDEIFHFYLRLFDVVLDEVTPDLKRHLAKIENHIDSMLHVKNIFLESEIQIIVNILCYTIKSASNNFKASIDRLVLLADRLTNEQVNQIIETLTTVCSGRSKYLDLAIGLFTFLNSLTDVDNALYEHVERLHDLMLNYLSNELTPNNFIELGCLVKSIVTFATNYFSYFSQSQQDELSKVILECHTEQMSHDLYANLSTSQRKVWSEKYTHYLKTINTNHQYDEKIFKGLPLFKADMDSADIIELVGEHMQLSSAFVDVEVIELSVNKIVKILSLANQALVNDILLTLLTILQATKDVPRRYYKKDIIMAFVTHFDLIYPHNRDVYLAILFEYLAIQFFYVDLDIVVKLRKTKVASHYWATLASAILAQPSHHNYHAALNSLVTVMPSVYLDEAINALCVSVKSSRGEGLFRLSNIISQHTTSFANETLLLDLIRDLINDFALDPLSFKSFKHAEMLRGIITIGNTLQASHQALDYIMNVVLKVYHQLNAAKQLTNLYYQSIFNTVFTSLSQYLYHFEIVSIAKQLFILTGGANPQLLINLFDRAPDISTRINIVKTVMEINAKQDYSQNPVLDNFLKLNSLKPKEILPMCEAVTCVEGHSIKRKQIVLLNLIQRLDNKSRIQFANSLSNSHGHFKKYLFLYVKALNQDTIISNYHFGLFAKRGCGPDIISKIKSFCHSEVDLMQSKMPTL